MDKDRTAFILSRQMHCLPQIQLCCRSASSAWSVPILPGGPLPSLPSCKPTETVDTCQAVPCSCSWLVIHLRVRAKRNRISFPAGLVCKLVFIVALQLLLVAAVFLSHLPDAGLCRELRTLPQGRGRGSGTGGGVCRYVKLYYQGCRRGSGDSPSSLVGGRAPPRCICSPGAAF